ncbi:hypothetical protein ACFO9Q_11410 [Paenibacillus sp. GCM10023252]|uniref:hypothetical protein n=1 Tax=Paenibacillus sp. GCM10023252 TaxID=3252649 RepID=UPI00361DFC60
MAHTRRLETNQDMQEAMEQEARIRVFQDNHVINSGGIITRFDEQLVVVQSGVSDVAYHDRSACEFYAIGKR